MSEKDFDLQTVLELDENVLKTSMKFTKRIALEVMGPAMVVGWIITVVWLSILTFALLV